MLKRTLMNGLVVMGLGFGTNVLAQEAGGAYLGASIGETSVEVSEVDFDSSDTSFKVFGGYAFNDFVAVELAWFDGGSPTESYAPFGDVGVELSGLSASFIGRLPVGEKFALFGKVGFTSYDFEVSASVNGQTVFSEDGSDDDVSYGAGAEFAISEQFGLRAEYEVVDAADAEFNLLSIGAAVRF